jgi:hypothetical protein
MISGHLFLQVVFSMIRTPFIFIIKIIIFVSSYEAENLGACVGGD